MNTFLLVQFLLIIKLFYYKIFLYQLLKVHIYINLQQYQWHKLIYKQMTNE